MQGLANERVSSSGPSCTIGSCGNPAIKKPVSTAGINSGLSELEISQRQEQGNT